MDSRKCFAFLVILVMRMSFMIAVAILSMNFLLQSFETLSYLKTPVRVNFNEHLRPVMALSKFMKECAIEIIFRLMSNAVSAFIVWTIILHYFKCLCNRFKVTFVNYQVVICYKPPEL